MPSDRSEGRGLATTRRTEQAAVLIGRQFEGYVGYSRDVVISDAEIYNFERVHMSSIFYFYISRLVPNLGLPL